MKDACSEQRGVGKGLCQKSRAREIICVDRVRIVVETGDQLVARRRDELVAPSARADRGLACDHTKLRERGAHRTDTGNLVAIDVNKDLVGPRATAFKTP